MNSFYKKALGTTLLLTLVGCYSAESSQVEDLNLELDLNSIDLEESNENTLTITHSNVDAIQTKFNCNYAYSSSARGEITFSVRTHSYTEEQKTLSFISDDGSTKLLTFETVNKCRQVKIFVSARVKNLESPKAVIEFDLMNNYVRSTQLID